MLSGHILKERRLLVGNQSYRLYRVYSEYTPYSPVVVSWVACVKCESRDRSQIIALVASGQVRCKMSIYLCIKFRGKNSGQSKKKQN